MTLKFSKNNLKFYITISVVLISFLVSLVFYFINYKKKFVFIFPAVEEGQYVLETRYFKKYNNKYTDYSADEYYIKAYLDDLLLGSTLERTKLLFNLGTRIEDCFIRNDVLYINLSKKLLEVGDATVDIKQGVQLLTDNVHKNFKIKKIELFVDGKYAFENEL